jgi:hypothetical protein
MRTIPPDNMTDEKRELLEYLKNRPLSSNHPYSYAEKYNSKDIVVYTDKEKRMYYILHNNKRLYFTRKMRKNDVRWCYNTLLVEQDVSSPHRYESADFRVCEGDVVVDACAAEGIFALSVVEWAKTVFV